MNVFMQHITSALGTLPLPSISLVGGAAVGGGAELASATPWRFGSAATKVHFVQTSKGLPTGWGGAAALCRNVSPRAAKRLLLPAGSSAAEELAQLGWLDDVLVDAPADATDGVHWDVSSGALDAVRGAAVGGPSALRDAVTDACASEHASTDAADWPTPLHSEDISDLSIALLTRCVLPRFGSAAGAPASIWRSHAVLAAGAEPLGGVGPALERERQLFCEAWRGPAHDEALQAAGVALPD